MSFPDQSNPLRGLVQDLFTRRPIIVATTTLSSLSESNLSTVYKTARTWARALHCPHLIPPLCYPSSILLYLISKSSISQRFSKWESAEAETQQWQLSSSKSVLSILSVKHFEMIRAFSEMKIAFCFAPATLLLIVLFFFFKTAQPWNQSYHSACAHCSLLIMTFINE